MAKNMNWQEYFYIENGVLRWIKDKCRAKAGDAAGTVGNNGYIVVKINQKRYTAHRIIWEMTFGKIPNGMEVDHINHCRGDNRIENLRLVTRTENRKNSSKYVNNKSGINGVRWCSIRNKWHAQIQVN